MSAGEKPVFLSDNASFETVLDTAIERLWETKVRYSMRRIQEMDAELKTLEHELDDMLLQKNKDETA